MIPRKYLQKSKFQDATHASKFLTTIKVTSVARKLRVEIATNFHVENRHFFLKSPHFWRKNPHLLKNVTEQKKIQKSLARPFLLLLMWQLPQKSGILSWKSQIHVFFSRKHKIYGIYSLKKIATRKKLIATWL